MRVSSRWDWIDYSPSLHLKTLNDHCCRVSKASRLSSNDTTPPAVSFERIYLNIDDIVDTSVALTRVCSEKAIKTFFKENLTPLSSLLICIYWKKHTQQRARAYWMERENSDQRQCLTTRPKTTRWKCFMLTRHTHTFSTSWRISNISGKKNKVKVEVSHERTPRMKNVLWKFCDKFSWRRRKLEANFVVFRRLSFPLWTSLYTSTTANRAKCCSTKLHHSDPWELERELESRRMKKQRSILIKKYKKVT